MKIAIVGTGGVGGYYGGLLAKQGHEVHFMARGKHLQAIHENGLQVKSVHGDFTIRPAHATDDPAAIGPVGLVLFCVKAYDTDETAQAIRPLVEPQTVIVSLQNGIDAAERIGSSLGREKMLGGATWLSSAVEAPGVIRQVSQFRRIVVGEFDGQSTPRLQSVFEALQSSGATVEMTGDIQKILWTKFTFICAISGVGSLTRLTVGEYREVPETRALLTALMGEVERLARARGIDLDPDVVAKSMATVDGSAAHIKPSMQLDVESGHRSELESMIGAIVRQGRELGLSTPAADVVYAALLPGLLKAQKS
jgi:2-dehydropantoate 2-reductase